VITATSRSAKPLTRYLQSVMIVEPNPNASRLLREVLVTFGARSICIESTTDGALARARSDNPVMIFTELSGPNLDGFVFISQLRRSKFECRRAPVVVCTSAPTAPDILRARDAGAHEVLRKPFSVADLSRRIEASTLKPRRWIEASVYVGPDRRRFNSGEYYGARRRQSEAGSAQRVGEAVQSLRFAIGSLDQQPQEALRAMQTQATELMKAGEGMGDEGLMLNAIGLQRTLEAVVAAGRFDTGKLEEACAPLWPYLPEAEAREA